ncbi:MAG: right-handed parallel beta-helix repeat-containing protein [Myxococcota bacterium]
MRAVAILLAVFASAAPAQPSGSDGEGEPTGRVLYVRLGGDDHADGTSPETAWRSLSRLSGALTAGDTAYVGPGLYRDQLVLRSSGTAERRIRVIADPEGAHTGDPAGPVLVTGSEPVDEQRFEPAGSPGVFQVEFPDFVPVGVVEMEGPQYRYMRARSTPEHLVDGSTQREVVASRPSTYTYDAEAQTLLLHTSDGAPPARHGLELIRRGAGITVSGQDFVTISGFTIRHTADAGILFAGGSSHGIALDNVCWGHRIGIRVNGATDVLVAGNTLFRNENSGVYFLREAVRGRALHNVLYENVKGVRFGSRSDEGQAIGNVAFRNHEVGVSVEDTAGTLVLNNRLVRNGDAQLLLLKTRGPRSDGNCFEAEAPDQALAGVDYDRHAELAAFRAAAAQDLGSRVGDCGLLPSPIDVHALLRAAEGLARP